MSDFIPIKLEWRDRTIMADMQKEIDNLESQKEELIKSLRSLVAMMVGETDLGWIPSPKFREMFPELTLELEKMQEA